MRMIAQSNEPSLIDAETSEGWTPEQQVAHLLELCEAQMESALSESDVAVEALIKAFTGLAENTPCLGALADTLPVGPHDAHRNNLDQQLAHIRKQIAHVIVAFQFYDKLTQRLGHVRYSLSTLAMFVCDKSKTGQRAQWERLFGTLRGLYRTEEERAIFQLMAQGASGEEARAQAEHRNQPRDGDATGEIELF